MNFKTEFQVNNKVNHMLYWKPFVVITKDFSKTRHAAIAAFAANTADRAQFIFYSYIVLLEYQLARPAVGKGYTSNPHGIHLDLKENRFRFPKLRQSNPIYFSDRYCQRFLLSSEI